MTFHQKLGVTAKDVFWMREKVLVQYNLYMHERMRVNNVLINQTKEICVRILKSGCLLELTP